MKNGKRPTKNQKILMKEQGLNAELWLVSKKLDNELHLVHRNTKQERIIPNS